MELLDVYDDNGNKTGKVVQRGVKDTTFKKNEHIAVSIIYIENSKQEYLIQKRPEKIDGLFSSTGGHILHNESPKEAIIREVKEELGIDISNEDIKDLGYVLFDFPVRFIFYLKKDIDLNSLKLQKEEVESVSYKGLDEIHELIDKKLMHKAHYKILELILENKIV